MKKLHCLLLVHGDYMEDLRRGIVAAAEDVDCCYAIMGERANELGPDNEFTFVESSTIADAAVELSNVGPAKNPADCDDTAL